MLKDVDYRSIEKRKRYYKKRRMLDKKNNLCIICHKPLDRKGSYCSACLEKQRDYHQKRKELLLSLGICPICGQNDIFEGEFSCPECKAKKTSPKYDEARKQYIKELTEKRREKGLCVRCGKRKADEGYVTCTQCRKANNAYKRKRSKKNVRQEWTSQLKCAICGSDELMPGKRVCEEHYRICVANIRTCNAKNSNGKKKWQETNMKMRARYRTKSE